MFSRKALQVIALTFIFLLPIFKTSGIFAQLTASFTPDKTGGCSPLTVSFANTTTGASSAAVYQWDLGNGNTSTLKNPGGTYRDEKTYTVTLTVKDAGQTSVKTQQVTVYKTPTVNLSPSITKGCVPLVINFTTNATPGDGTIESYFWDFGDGVTQSTTSAQQSHTYNFPQSPAVSLTVKNNYGCYTTLQKPALIEAVPGISISFAADKTVLCKTGDAVKFSNTSTGPSDVTWLWDFGDGTTSTQKEPLRVYDKKGIFPVKLSANSASGCSNSETKAAYINVANFLTDFDIPSLLCQNTNLNFSNSSSPNPNSSSWYVDDRLVWYSVSSLQYNFYDQGTHKVKLVNTFGTCQDEVTKSFEVKPAPKLNGFVVDMGGACGAPLNIQLKDTSAAAVKWSWSSYPYYTNFSTIKEPVLPVDQDRTFDVRLTITDVVGCSTELFKYITVAKPNVYINAVSSTGEYLMSGCEGMTMKFSCSESDQISEYKWDFGDGGTSAEAQPAHTFTKAGNYFVKVNYTTKAGCKGTAVYSTFIEVNKKPKADFTSANGTTICGNTPTTFNADYGNNNQVTGFLWKVDDVYTYNGSNNGSVFTHKFTNDTIYTITLIVNNGACRDTLVKTNYITVLPPFPKIGQITNTCNDTRGLVTIKDETTKAQQWKWDFGDGTTALTYANAQANVQHLYKKSGKYKVVLTATNGSCTVKDSLTAYAYLKQKPTVSSSQTEICASSNISLTLSNMEDISFVDYYYYGIGLTKTEYGDGTSFNGYNSGSYYTSTPFNISFQNLEAGKKDMRLIFQTNYFYCYDTSNYVPLKIKGPRAGYEIKNNNTCFKNPVVFQDTSKSSFNVPITRWDWNFGNNTTQTVTNNNPITISYNTPGSYFTQLKVTDADGCSNTSFGNYQNYAIVTGPAAAFSYSPTSVQPGATVDFFNITNNYNSYTVQYQWLFKDGTTYYTNNASKFYPTIGTDTVMLIAKNLESTCADTAVKVIIIKNVNAAFTYTSSYINNNSCPPVIIKFTNTSANFTKVSWDFGDGSRTDNQNFPSHTYYKPGVYLVTLYATSSTGVTDSIVDSVTVKGPYAVLKADRFSGCGSQAITLSAEVRNATSYTWDFADGELKDTRDTFAVHTYTVPGIYTPSLILKDAGGCSGTSDLPDKIVIDTLNISFSKTPQQVCDSAYVKFTPVVNSLAADQMQQSLQYHWNFATGNLADTADTPSPVFNFNKPGKYPVGLTVTSPYGCVKQTTDTLFVIQKAKASIAGPAEICEQSNALFTGSANLNTGIGWSWNFGNGNSSNIKNAGEQLYNASGNFQVRLITNNSGCYDTAVQNIIVHAKPSINLLPKNPTVCLGKSIQLNAGGGVSYQWNNNVGLNNYTSANAIANPLVTTQYIVEATNSFGCKNKDTSVVNIAGPFKLKVPSDTFVCRGNSAQLYATGASTYKWINNTTGLSNPAIASPVATPLTASVYSVVGYDAYQCFTDTAIVRIGVQSFPTVSAGPDVEAQTGSEVQLQATGSSDVVGYSWSPADYLSCTTCPAPVSKPRSEVSYIVKATNRYGCFVTDTVHIKLVCAQSRIYIPTAFTPNKDFKNDIFYPKGGGVKQVNFLKIYNRAGQVVFERRNFNLNDPSSGWNGMVNGYEVSSGTYVYFTEMVCDTGEVFSFKGTVVVIK